MEFIKSSFFNTTTLATVDSGTLTVKNVLNRDPIFQYVSDGFNDDLTQTAFVVAFDATQTVSRIGIQGMNLKAFDIFFNGTTANTFALTSSAATTVSSFTSNSETAMYLFATPQACTSVTFDLKSTQVADQEKAFAFLVISDLQLDFERLPSAKNYTPLNNPKEVTHRLSDGGTRIQRLTDKFSVKVKYSNITTTFRDNLKTVYDLRTTTVFVPFGTSTGWDEIMFSNVWPGRFDFFKFSDDAADAGFSGNINLVET